MFAAAQGSAGGINPAPTNKFHALGKPDGCRPPGGRRARPSYPAGLSSSGHGLSLVFRLVLGVVEQKGAGGFIRSGGEAALAEFGLAAAQALNAAFAGRGGGKPAICQGSCAGQAQDVAAFLAGR